MRAMFDGANWDTVLASCPCAAPANERLVRSAHVCDQAARRDVHGASDVSCSGHVSIGNANLCQSCEASERASAESPSVASSTALTPQHLCRYIASSATTSSATRDLRPWQKPRERVAMQSRLAAAHERLVIGNTSACANGLATSGTRRQRRAKKGL